MYRYSEEFKKATVELAKKTGDKNAAEVMGCSKNSVWLWKSNIKGDMSGKKFTNEFKRSVVSELKSNSAAETSKKYNIGVSTIYKWKSEINTEKDKSVEVVEIPKPTAIVTDELHKIKEENAKLRETNSMLKKMVCFFTKDWDKPIEVSN